MFESAFILLLVISGYPLLHGLVRFLGRDWFGFSWFFPDRPPAPPYLVRGRRTGSVSYTHLTLPTIYSV